MKAIIIDDELSGREVLKKLVEVNCPDVTIVNTLNSIESGLHSIREDKPDLVFLDIQMPEISGLEFTKSIQDLGIPVAILIKPFGELPSGEPVPTASFNQKPIVRCRDCRAYINPFVKFIDNGSRWICNFCRLDNVTESYYFS